MKAQPFSDEPVNPFSANKKPAMNAGFFVSKILLLSGLVGGFG